MRKQTRTTAHSERQIDRTNKGRQRQYALQSNSYRHSHLGCLDQCLYRAFYVVSDIVLDTGLGHLLGQLFICLFALLSQKRPRFQHT